MVEMHWNYFRVVSIPTQRNPLHNVSFNRVSKIVHGASPIGKPEVNHRGNLGFVAPIAPQQIRSVQIVVRPPRRQLRQQRQ